MCCTEVLANQDTWTLCMPIVSHMNVNKLTFIILSYRGVYTKVSLTYLFFLYTQYRGQNMHDKVMVSDISEGFKIFFVVLYVTSSTQKNI